MKCLGPLGLKARLSYDSLILISVYRFNNRQRGLVNNKTSKALLISI